MTTSFIEQISTNEIYREHYVLVPKAETRREISGRTRRNYIIKLREKLIVMDCLKQKVHFDIELCKSKISRKFVKMSRHNVELKVFVFDFT